MPDMPVSHPPDDLRERVADACRIGDFNRAREAVADLLAQNAGGGVLRFVAGQVTRHKAGFENIKASKLAVLSSYSSEFLHDALVVSCFLQGVAPEIYRPAFNQFRQEILDPGSGLYRFAPDVVILSALGEDLWPGPLLTGSVQRHGANRGSDGRVRRPD